MFHHAVTERLGLGPTDHKCLDLLRERGAMTGSDLAAITGLTTGAITGMVVRRERAGFLRREPDPHDGRKQILHPALERVRDIENVFGPIREDMAALLEGFDTRQFTAIAEFLTSGAEIAYLEMPRYCARKPSAGPRNQPPPRSSSQGRNSDDTRPP